MLKPLDYHLINVEVDLIAVMAEDEDIMVDVAAEVVDIIANRITMVTSSVMADISSVKVVTNVTVVIRTVMEDINSVMAVSSNEITAFGKGMVDFSNAVVIGDQVVTGEAEVDVVMVEAIGIPKALVNQEVDITKEGIG